MSEKPSFQYSQPSVFLLLYRLDEELAHNLLRSDIALEHSGELTSVVVRCFVSFWSTTSRNFPSSHVSIRSNKCGVSKASTGSGWPHRPSCLSPYLECPHRGSPSPLSAPRSDHARTCICSLRPFCKHCLEEGAGGSPFAQCPALKKTQSTFEDEFLYKQFECKHTVLGSIVFFSTE